MVWTVKIHNRTYHENTNYIFTAVVISLSFLALFLAYVALQDISQNQDRVREVYKIETQQDFVVENTKIGSWSYGCFQKDIGNRVCSATQKIKSDEGHKVLRANLSLIKRGNSTLPRLKISAPLNIFLPSGISIVLDSQEPLVVPFQFCTIEGCFINLDLADEVVSALKRSEKLYVTYRNMERKNENTVISLSGFSEVLDQILKDHVDRKYLLNRTEKKS